MLTMGVLSPASLGAKVCGVCHEARRAASVRLTREGWDTVIQQMVTRGAKGTPEELAQVLDYLATNFLGEAARPGPLSPSPARVDYMFLRSVLTVSSTSHV